MSSSCKLSCLDPDRFLAAMFALSPPPPHLHCFYHGRKRNWEFSLFFLLTFSRQKTIVALLGGKSSRQCSRHGRYSDLSIKATSFFFLPDETRSSVWKGLPLRTLFGTMGLWLQLGPGQATIKQMIIKQAGGNLRQAPLPVSPTLVYSHILRHYFKSRWCSVVEQTSNYPPDTPQGLPACDRKKLLHPKLRAVVWLFSIIGRNQV